MSRLAAAVLSVVLALGWGTVSQAAAGPSVVSIVPSTTAASSAPTENFTVTFDRAVSGVAPDDFSLTLTDTATGTVSGVSGSGSTYTVSVTGITGTGTIRLDMKATGTNIFDSGFTPISGGFAAGTPRIVSLPATPVPTLSEWATILMGLMLAGGTMVVIQRRRAAV